MIVASGPSAKTVPLHLAKTTCRFIAVNNSWQLAPWSDLLYGCDFNWWKSVDGCPEFAGLKASENERVCTMGWGILKVDANRGVDHICLNRDGRIGWGSNGGFQAFNLALHFKVSRILLVGFDATLDHGAHWHGQHSAGLSNPNANAVDRWRRALDGAATVVADHGVDVVNCSMVSALRKYPKVPFEQALEKIAA